MGPRNALGMSILHRGLGALPSMPQYHPLNTEMRRKAWDALPRSNSWGPRERLAHG